MLEEGRKRFMRSRRRRSEETGAGTAEAAAAPPPGAGTTAAASGGRFGACTWADWQGPRVSLPLPLSFMFRFVRDTHTR